MRLPVLAHENLSWDCLRLLVDHWYFSSTILALPAAAIPSLKSDTSAILPALSMWSLTKQAKTNVPRVLMFVLFSPSHCHYIRAPLFSCQGLQGHPAWAPCPQACFSILFTTLQLECYFECSNLIFHSLASKPKPCVLAFNTHHTLAPPQVHIFKLSLLACSGHATPSCRSPKHHTHSDSYGASSPQPDTEKSP